jgi:putative DNA primase/helicase
MATNENPRTSRGRGTAVCWDGRDPITAGTLNDALRAACAEVGIVDRDVPADGRWHKTDIDGDSRGRGDGRIKLFPDGEGGIVWNWKGETRPFFVDDGRKLTEAERRDRERKRAESIRRAREKEARRHAGAARKASAIWKAAQPAPREHPYLTRKQTQAHGARLYRGPLVVDGMPCDGSLIVPACDGSGAIHTLEFIHPKTRGGDNKRFLPGGDSRGRYFSIGTMEGAGPLCVCEGFATGATIHEATGYPVVGAFNDGNLEPVAQALRAKFPNLRLVLCADDDAATDGNPGLTKATEAAQAVAGLLAVPDFGENRDPAWTDFNDLAVHQGPEVVAECIRRQVESGAGEGAPEKDETEPGNGAAPSDETGSWSSGQDSEGGDHATGDAEDLEATVRRLAALSAIEYDRVRIAEADALGVRVPTLDAEVEKARPKLVGDGNDSQGEAVLFPDIEPSPEPVDGAILLTELKSTFTRYVVLPKHGAVAIALWIVFTHCIAVMSIAPILAITSPEKRCGKSTLLALLGRLVLRRLPTANISAAALFRAVEAWAPTLLIDEADTFIRDSDDLRGILNSGHTRELAFVIRTVGDDHEPRKFSTWGAKAIALIGKLKDTLADRSIEVALKRKLPEECVERLRHADPEVLHNLARRCVRWAMNHAEEIRAARPSMPDALHDRAQDNWEPLLAIADLAGGSWPKLARTAALALSHAVDPGEDTLGVQLLSDIRDVFKGSDRISSEDLTARLVALEERPWAECSRGKPLTQNRLARLLRLFGVVSGSRRFPDGTTPKGYLLDQFADAFKRYLLPPKDPPSDRSQDTPTPGDPSSKAPRRHKQDGTRVSGDFESATGDERGVSEKGPEPSCSAGCGGVADSNAPSWGLRL